MVKIISYVFLIFFCSCHVFAETTKPVSAKHAMVVSAQHLASQVGVDILASGGNAMDAAVAVGYALAVVHPCCGNIGGGGFITLHTAKGKNIFLNFREKAPLAAKKNMFLDKKKHVIPDLSTKGYLAVGVPGTVLGLDTLLTKYGTMTRQEVMAPAIQLAEKGYALTPGDIKFLSKFTKDFRTQPNVAKIFLKTGGRPYQAGDTLIQKELANTLKLIAKFGPAVFYQGKIAEDIVRASQQHGGILSLKDFSSYRVEELSPLFCRYDGYTLISAPPPSSGGTTLCEILNIVESYPLKKFGFHTAKSTHYIVEAMRYAFYDRNNQLGDPDFVSNPVEKLISKDYAEQVRQKILDLQASPSRELNHAEKSEEEGLHTTHYSIMDQNGNAISVTYTLNSFFGAKVIAGKTGFFLNNEMDDFAVKAGSRNKFGLIQGNKNTIAPGKRPLSSMTPTIITKNKRVVMIVGSPGGPRIITSTLLTILNVLDYGMNIQEAVNAPRFHHQWLPDTIYAEPHTFSNAAIQELTDMGYHITPNPAWGAVEAIFIHMDNKKIEGANDIRRPAGKAAGY